MWVVVLICLGVGSGMVMLVDSVWCWVLVSLVVKSKKLCIVWLFVRVCRCSVCLVNMLVFGRCRKVSCLLVWMVIFLGLRIFWVLVVMRLFVGYFVML